MKKGLGLCFLAQLLFFFPSTSQAAAPPASAATQKLAAAHNALTAAVARIAKDPPATADLDDAAAAVSALKEAIDAGAEFEQSDLDYARAALAARKDLRVQREYVDSRRANIKIHEARRTIDASLKTLSESMSKVEDKSPELSTFSEAESAAAAVKKLLDPAREFTKQDPKFASYVAETDATVARALKTIDERRTLLGADKQRALVTEGRQSLKGALERLGPNPGDDDFKAVDKARDELAKLLEQGKALEPKNNAYRADTDKARAELTAAKKKMDDLWTATGLARLKAQIEPAYKDMVAAGKAARSRQATADQLGEAKTAAIVVRGLVEKFRPEAARSQAFGQYVEQVSKALAEVESDLEQRALASAKRDVLAAQRAIERATATDEQFQEMNTAMTVLEKTLGTVHAKEAAMVEPVADAKQVLRDAKAMANRRRLEVDVDRQRTKVEQARKIASDALAQLNQPGFGEEQLKGAESSVKLIGSVLEAGAELTQKDRAYGAYDREVKLRIGELNARIAIKRQALEALNARRALTDGAAEAAAKIETAKAPEAKDSDVEAAGQSVEAIGKLLETQAPLEKKDQAYAAAAERSKENLYRLQDKLAFAQAARDLRKSTGETCAAATAAVEAAGSNDLRARKSQYDKALGLYRACQTDGSRAISGNPALAKLPVLFEGKTVTPGEVMAQCAERATATEKLAREVVPMIKFEDGPKKSFESAKVMLDRKDGPGALPHLNECIATGTILQNQFPEMKGRKLGVAGSSMTISEMIAQCLAQRKTVQGK